jgi:hypothetical protein
LSTKAELRRKVVDLTATAEQHKQTHSVFKGKFRIPAWKDGDLIRALAGNYVLARRKDKGWTGVVKTVSLPKPGRFDHVTAFGPCINCNGQSLWDGINKGAFF